MPEAADRHTRRFILTTGALSLAAAAAHAQSAPASPAVQWGEISLYQAEILDRVFPSEDRLYPYIDRLQLEAERIASAAAIAQPATGLLFVAIKPGDARIWVLGESANFPPELKQAFERSLSDVPGMDVAHCFLMGWSFGVGGAAPVEPENPPPIPREWNAQIPPEGVMLDNDFILRVWPD